MILFRKQIAQIAIGKLPQSWSNHVESHSVENKWSELVKAGLNKNTATRILKADFAKSSRASTVVNNQELISKLTSFLTDQSELAHRVRDSYRILGSEEKERARILNKPWDQLFKEFNQLLQSENLAPVSKTCLRKIRKKYLKNFRQAAKRDIEYAQCNVCSKIDMMLCAARKNRYIGDWPINKESLLELSVCDNGNDDCIWNKCNNCDIGQTIYKVKSACPNFEAVKHQMINWPELCKYKKKNAEIHKWIQQVTTIDEFVSELADALFCSKMKATGSKVYHVFFFFF